MGKIVVKILVAFIAGIITCALAGAIIFTATHSKAANVHKLEFPLLLTSDDQSNGFYMLPKGTTLYFDRAYPEGFTRYKIYVNIDRMPLKLDALSDPTLIIPLDASAPDKENMEKLLREYPLTKNDLASILKSGTLSKEEIKDVFADFLR